MRSGIKKSKSKILESKPRIHLEVSVFAATKAFGAATSENNFSSCWRRFFPSFCYSNIRFHRESLSFQDSFPTFFLHRKKILFCGDKVELHFVVLEEQKHNREFRKLETEWLLRTPLQLRPQGWEPVSPRNHGLKLAVLGVWHRRPTAESAAG